MTGLKRRQWKALARGLELERANRPADAAAFMRELRGPTPVKKGVAAAIMLLVGLSGALAMLNVTRDDEGPEFPFAQLPVETRERFSSLLQQGDAELEFDLQSALHYYEQAYLLHERNPEVEARLEYVANLIIDDAPDFGDRNRLRDYLRDLQTLSGREHLKNYARLRDEREVGSSRDAGNALIEPVFVITPRRRAAHRARGASSD